jgi:nitrite reductase/ring-hydroxylating ferredoxin subunit
MCVAELGGTEVLLARVGAQVFAVENLCSHAEGWLDMGVLHPASCEVQCPLHDGRFDLTSGAPTREPCTKPIRTYPVDVRDDAIYVGITAAGTE